MIKATIQWKYNGKSGVFVMEMDVDLETADYMWDDGNYGCDCNKSKFFGLPEMPCGSKIETKCSFEEI